MVGIPGTYQYSGEKKNPAMPGSPVEVKVHSRSIPSAMPPLPPINPSGPRPASFSSTALTNGINHSPPTLNGVPSPPQRFSNGPSSSSSSSLANQQLPATCGARQLSKLKRFLTTLQQFGNDISPEIGESVRNLVLALVNSTVTIEEFHGRLQEATNFPLRPFVIPFLKANLPLLQRELLHCARAAKQTPAQYLSQHEHLLLSTTMASPPDSSELLLETNENGKRRSPDRGKENGFHERVPVAMEPPAKRICTISPAPRHSPAPLVPLPLNTQHHPTPPPLQHYALEDVTGPHSYRDPQRLLEVRDVKERPRHPGTNGGYREEPMDHRLTEREWADEWRHLDHVRPVVFAKGRTEQGVQNVLNCIVDMVEKTRRSIAVLRRCQEADREEMHYWRRRSSEHEEERKSTPSKQSSPRGGGDSDSQFTPRSGYVPDEIWRKAEEAVNEVKRQAMGEVQKAVAEAEQKALELVTVERARMEKTLAEAKRQATKDAIQVINEQEDSSESCWNCGRKASETCSGCNAARYCGSFCQHKDWERHHLICSPGLQAQPKPPSAVPGRVAGKFPDSVATASPALEKITTTASRSSTPASVSAAETNGH
ncbi:protein CBFA2T2-like isoform X1 [Huso huso]|uniref:Protein CBFA2T2-like isoform X1 n=1 Tax=Huso huso TaxID=61971 RepID=A0ABR0Z3V2_HUSHU